MNALMFSWSSCLADLRRRVPRYSGINVHATGSSVITLGDGNIVNARFESLHHALRGIKDLVVGSNSLGDSAKLEAAVDIETIRDQLAKPHLDSTLIQRLWSQVEQIATLGGFAEAASKVGRMFTTLGA